MAKHPVPAEKTEVPAEMTHRTARAVTRYLRISPRKVRLVIDTIRRKHPARAFAILMVLKKKAARMVEKTLHSAVANAKDLGLDEARLYVADIRADTGPTMKRFMSRSMGRADRILKRSTHLSLILREGDKRWDLTKIPVVKRAAQSEPGAKPAGAKAKSEKAAKAGA